MAEKRRFLDCLSKEKGFKGFSVAQSAFTEDNGVNIREQC